MVRPIATRPAAPPATPPVPAGGSPPRLRVRPADRTDARWVAGLWAEAFPGEPRVEVRLQALLEGTGPYGGLDTCWIAESEGRPVGAFRHYPLTMHLWGRPFPAQGLASVAVAPSARRRGLGRALCLEALALAREKGAVLSALYPFRMDFYRRIGFVPAGELHRYRFPTAELVPGGPPRPGDSEGAPGRGADRSDDRAGAFRVERISRGEAHRTLARVYDALLPRANGLVERTPAMWKGILDGGHLPYAAVDGSGTLRGYLLARGVHGRTPDRSLLRVRELIALDDGARDALLGWLADQRDQWRYLQYDALPGEEFHRLLAHPRAPGSPQARGLWFPSATLLRGPMVRVVDRDGEPDEIARRTEDFLAGRLPELAEAVRSFRPALGRSDFRLLDIF